MLARKLLLFALVGAVGCATAAARPQAGGAPPGSAAAGTAATLATAAPASGARALTTVEGITEYQLPNGLRVLLFPDSSKPTVTVNVTYFVGSRHEGYGESGMAHLLEHMLFKGTTKHQNPWKELKDHGALFNGSTWVDRTNYYETVPSEGGNLEWALELEADRMINSRISAEDLSHEFSVVRNEFEMGENDPRGILEQRMYAAAYEWHNYGKSTIGSRSDIERVPVDNLRAFYQRFYQPDNAILVVAGKFDPQKTLGEIGKTLGAIPRPSRKLNATYTVEPAQDGEHQVMLRRTGDVAVVGLMYHGVASADEDHVAEEALVHLLTAQPSGRLYKALVEKGLAASVEGAAYDWAEPGMFQLSAAVRLDKADRVEQVRQRMIELVERLGRGKIGDDEVERFKTKALKDFELGMANSGHIGVELSEWAAAGDWRLLFVHRDRVKKLTAEQVRRFAAAHFKQSNRTVGVFQPTKAPDRSPLPPPVDVASLVKDYKGEKAMAEGENFDATIENIEHRTTRSQLPSGAKIALLPKKTRGAAVTVGITVHFGREADVRGKTVAASLLPQLLLRGTQKHTYQQLKDELDKLKAQVSFGAGGIGGESANASSIHITTIRDNLPAVLGLVAECLKQPVFPKDQFEIVRKEEIAQLEEQLQEPQALAFTTVFRRLTPFPKDDVRYLPTIAEQIERLRAARLADVTALHHNLWGASNTEISVVGDFDGSQIKNVLARELGDWKSPRPYERIAVPFKDTPGGDETIKTPDKQMAVVGAAHRIAVRDDDPDYPALLLINHLLGGGGQSRLSDRLRQKEGLSYAAFSFVHADPFDRNGVFFAGAICAPQNADKAMAAMLDELDKLLKSGVPEKELAEAKHSYKLLFANQLASNSFVADMLSGELHTKRTGEYYQKLNDRIQALSAAELERVLHEYFHPAKLFKIKAGDLK
jgi:zinc protease